MKLVQRVLHRAAALRPAGALLAAALLPVPLAAREPAVVLASGPEGGIYHRLAQGIQRRLQGTVTVRVVPKPDCAESLDWLEKETDEVRFAFAQQDLAGERFRTSPGTPVRVVDRIAVDYLHVFVRESLQADVTELAGRKIWAGEEGSATRFTAEHLLDSLGARLENPLTYQEDSRMSWEPGDLRAEDYAVRELSRWFQTGRLDAAMLMAPAGSPEVCSLMLQARCALTSLNRQTRRRLEAGDRLRDPFLNHIAIGDLPPGTYVNQGSSVTTIAIPVVLMINRQTGRSTVIAVRDAALAEWDDMVTDSQARQGCRMNATRPAMAPLAEWPLKLYPHIDRPDDRSTPLIVKAASSLTVLLLAAAGIYASRRQLMRWARVGIRTLPAPSEIGILHLIGMLAGVLALSMLVITSLIFWAEHDTNDDFSSFWESWWSITLYIFSGLENRAPYTAVGRFLGAAGLGLSWFLSVIGTGSVAGIFIRKEGKMPKLTDHYLLLNWNGRALDILEELHHDVLQRCGRTTPLIILTDEKLELRQFAEFADVYPRNGDPTDEATLLKANVQEARVVIILADERYGDDRTIRSILQIRKIARAKKRELRVVAELLDPSNEASITELAEDFPGRLESVSGLKLRTCVISQAVLTEGITEFYTDLLSVKEGTNEVYTLPIPPTAENKTFREYAAFLIESSQAGDPFIPVGVHRMVGKRAKIFTNPKPGEEGEVLKRGDSLVLIAYGPPQNALPAPPPRVSPVG